jgi:hypothetical protein
MNIEDALNQPLEFLSVMELTCNSILACSVNYLELVQIKNWCTKT